MAQKIQHLTVFAISLLLVACNEIGLQQVSQSHSGAFEVSLAPVGKRMAVAWNEVVPAGPGYHSNDTRSEVFVRQMP